MNNEEKILSMLEHLTSKVDNLEQDLTSKVEHVTSNLEHLTSKVEHLTSNLEHLTSKVEHLTSKVDNLEQDLTDTKRIVIKIEHEHGRQLGVLFDGYKQLYDISKEIRKDVSELKATQEKQELQLRFLDSAAT